MTTTLFEDVGPNGNVEAVVEADDMVCCFYLFGTEESGFETKSVWIRNLVAAPAELDRDRMLDGNPPLNPAAHCRHPGGQPVPDEESLRVVWLPEGNGVALYENDEVLAIIPPWSGQSGFYGYCRDAIGDGPLAWELTPDNVLLERFEDAQAWWDSWDDDPWPSVQDALISRIECDFGKHSNYYAIDGGNWPPKAILRIPREDGVVLATIGVSLRPQPMVEMSTETPELLRRIELAALLPVDWSDQAIKQFASYISAQSGLPWSHYTWLGHGHTIPCDSWQNPQFTAALLVNNLHTRRSLGNQFGDPINVLWFVPINEEERQIAMDHGSDTLLARLPNDRWQQA
jgi:hypothetical protein